MTLDELRARAADIAAKTPSDRYDLESRARSLPGGVEAAFRLVRDHIRYESYRGVLRGAEVAYTTRAGNAFDRSLLLAELLRHKGISTRFVTGALGRSEADRLFARIFEPARAEPGARTAELSTSPEGQALLTRLRARAARDYVAVEKALGSIPLAPASPPIDEVMREIQEHAWVQARLGEEWVDLDTAFPDATPGRAYARVDRTLDAFPAELHQRVTLRVVTEWVSGETLSLETVLEVTAAAEELLDREIHLVHGPIPADIAGAITKSMLSAQGGEPWVPMLSVDGALHVGTPFAFLEQTGAGPRGGGPPSGGLRGIFGPGGALGADRQFVSERLEVEILYPGGRLEKSLRVLADRSTVDWRASAAKDASGLRALERDDKGLIAPRVFHNLWFSAGRHNLAAYVQAVDELYRAVTFGTPPALPTDTTIGEQLWPLAVQNFVVLVVSDHLIVPALNDGPNYRFYADAPRLLIVSMGPDPGPGPNGTVVTYDLRRDRLRGVLQSPAAAQAVAERKVWFGLLQGALEHDMAAQLATAEPSTSKVTSTSNLLTKEGVVAVRPGGAIPPDLLPADADAAVGVRAALSAGRTVLIPRSLVSGGRWGWWELSAEGDLSAVVRGLMMGEFRGGGRFGGSSGSGGGKIHYVDPKTYSATPPKKAARPGRAAGKQQRGGTDQWVGVVVFVVGGIMGFLVLDHVAYRMVGVGTNWLASIVNAVLGDGTL